MNKYVYMDFILAVDEEIQGIHPAVVISNDSYNSNSNYLMVVPITLWDADFDGCVVYWNAFQ